MSDPFSQPPAATPRAVPSGPGPLRLQPQMAAPMPQMAAAPMPQMAAVPVPQMAAAPVPQMAAAPMPPPAAAPRLQQVAPTAATPGPAGPPPAAPGSLPADFVYDSEHPVLTIPFSAQFGDTRLQGTGISAAAAFVGIAGTLDPRWAGRRGPARLSFEFEGFAVVIPVEVMVAGSRRPGEMTLQFVDPLGPHLPQLRHLLNSHIAGDMVTLGGFLSYTGPTKPKSAPRPEGSAWARRLRSLMMALVSTALIAMAGGLMLWRATQSTELRPVFIERDGRVMRATTAGQLSYLNPAATRGEVLFSINSNTGDVLNFQLPCDCTVEVTSGVYEGATVLPDDVILSIFEGNLGVRVETLISIEGLARVMNGDHATLRISDGRSMDVTVEVSTATQAAAAAGEEFVPVTLTVPDGAITSADIGKSGRLRLSSGWLSDLMPSFGAATP